MGLELEDDDVREIPNLALVRTKKELPGGGDLAAMSTGEEVNECSTPGKKKAALAAAAALALMVCPAAPRKAKRKQLGDPRREVSYFPVPNDLASVFVPLSCLPPPASKKIRVAGAT